MAKKKPLRIGLIGYGFMGRTHSNAFRKVPNFFPELKYEPQLAAVCARNKDRAEAFADQWGYESVETDWKKLVARDDIDVIDIAAPNNVHHEIAIAAARAGKGNPLRKAPCSQTARKVRKWCAKWKKPGVANMVWYNYRRIPAVTMAKEMIDEGRLGKGLSLPFQLPSGLDHQY